MYPYTSGRLIRETQNLGGRGQEPAAGAGDEVGGEGREALLVRGAAGRTAGGESGGVCGARAGLAPSPFFPFSLVSTPAGQSRCQGGGERERSGPVGRRICGRATSAGGPTCTGIAVGRRRVPQRGGAAPGQVPDRSGRLPHPRKRPVGRSTDRAPRTE